MSEKTQFDDMSLALLSKYVQAQDQGPPASLYLAVREARRALIHNPDDAGAYLTLAEAYSRLGRQTREFSRTHVLFRPPPGPGAGGQPEMRSQPFLPHVSMIRHSQIVAALNGVLAVKPRPELARVAHKLLAEAYKQQPAYFELRVKHEKEFLRLTRAMGTPTGLTAEQFKEHLEQLDKDVKELERGPEGLHRRQDKYEVDSGNKPPLQKARKALENGLAETALNVLQKAEGKDLIVKRGPQEPPGITLAITLLLGLGRLEEAREALDQKDKDGKPIDRRVFGMHELGLPAYAWLQVQLAAASGDYAAADEYLSELARQAPSSPAVSDLLLQMDVLPRSREEKAATSAELAALMLGNILLKEAPQAAGLPWQIRRHLPVQVQEPVGWPRPGWRPELGQSVQVLQALLQQEADLHTLRAWLAVEAGDMTRAGEQARAALELTLVRGEGGVPLQVMLFRSRPLAFLCLQLAEEGKKAGR